MRTASSDRPHVAKTGLLQPRRWPPRRVPGASGRMPCAPTSTRFGWRLGGAPARGGPMADRSEDRRAVELVNSTFYEAFETADIDTMQDLWLDDPETLCVHPG